MNMQTHTTWSDTPQDQPFITEMVISVESMGAGQGQEKQAQTKMLLDELFPLDSGSHGDVTGYVIDYHHVLAYFRDGSHSGLQYPNHFIAYLGDRNEPKSILFRNGDGCYVEVTLGARRGTGCLEVVDIEDIQLETCTHLNAMASERHATLCIRYWVSLVKSDAQGHPLVSSEYREYQYKGRGEYQLDMSFDQNQSKFGFRD